MKERRADTGATDGRMRRKRYEKELRKLQTELCRLQEWVKLPKRSDKGKYDDQATLEGRKFVPEKY